MVLLHVRLLNLLLDLPSTNLSTAMGMAQRARGLAKGAVRAGGRGEGGARQQDLVTLEADPGGVRPDAAHAPLIPAQPAWAFQRTL